MAKIASPYELDLDLCRRACQGESLDPDRCARAVQQAFAADVNDLYDHLKAASTPAQHAVLDREILRYKEAVLQKYSACLMSGSPVLERLFCDWRVRARAEVARAVKDAGRKNSGSNGDLPPSNGFPEI